MKTLRIPSEITALAPKIILEIGTACGDTLVIWSSIASGGEPSEAQTRLIDNISSGLVTATPDLFNTCV